MSFGVFEFLIVFLLIVLNGLFAMSEIAIISARKARLQQAAEQGDEKARAALELAGSPNLFLSTTQIGITLVGVLSGAFGGATLAGRLAAVLESVPLIGPYSDSISLIVVVLGITYLSLVIGELVPKRIAMNNPERIAGYVASTMRTLSRVTSPLIKLLSASTDLVLGILKMRLSTEPPVTEEEIRLLIGEATLAGVFDETEQDMVERVFRLGDRSVAAMMVPRKKIEWLDITDPAEKIRRRLVQSAYSRFPVCNARLGNLLGVVHVKDVLTRLLSGQSFDLKACIQKPLFVVEGTHTLKVMEKFRETGSQMAIVVDEYGTIEGLVTLNDILEAIVGELPSLDELEEPRVFQRDEGSWLVDGMLPADEIKPLFHVRKLPGERTGLYQTLGGFIMTYLKRVPAVGDNFECCGLRFEVVDMDGRRVDKVLIQVLPEAPSEGPED